MKISVLVVLISLVVSGNSVVVRKKANGSFEDSDGRKDWVKYNAELDEKQSNYCTQNGDFPNPLDCHTFYKCSNGDRYLMYCPELLVWDPTSRTCVWDNGTYCNYDKKVMKVQE